MASQLDKLEEAESLTIAPNQFLNLEYGLKQSCHLRDLLLKRPAVWAQLSKGEDALIQPIEAILKAQQEREEREYKEEKMRHETEKTQGIPKAQRAAETLRGLLEKSSMVFNATAPAVRNRSPQECSSVLQGGRSSLFAARRRSRGQPAGELAQGRRSREALLHKRCTPGARCD